MISIVAMRILILMSVISFSSVLANTECFWATGQVLCKHNQTKVIGAVIVVYDLDRHPEIDIPNPLDPDDKAAVTVIEQELGLFEVDGCASDQDWIPGLKNRPEFYFKIFHHCNSESGDTKIVTPLFRVYTPQTYDYHIKNPIVLDG